MTSPTIRRPLRVIAAALVTTTALAAASISAAASPAIGTQAKIGPAAVADTSQPAPATSVLFYDGFDSGTLDPANWTAAQRWGDAGKSQAYFTSGNTIVQDGLLQLVSKRHCIAPGDVPHYGNETTALNCPAGTEIKYSAGRVDGIFETPVGVNWEIRVAAVLPANGTIGTRVAFWAKNNQPYCSENNKTSLGEVDLLEWYPDRARDAAGRSVGDSVTHMSCSGSTSDPRPWETERMINQPQFDDKIWLEWITQRVGNSIRYYLGSPAVGYYKIGDDHVCGTGAFGFTQARCSEILDNPWHVILQNEVFERGYNNHAGPYTGFPFPKQTTLIDWVKVSQL